jgi:hypothetical protein
MSREEEDVSREEELSREEGELSSEEERLEDESESEARPMLLLEEAAIKRYQNADQINFQSTSSTEWRVVMHAGRAGVRPTGGPDRIPSHPYIWSHHLILSSLRIGLGRWR